MVGQIVRTTVPHHPSLLQIKALYCMDAYLLINLGCNVTLQVSSSVPWSFYSYAIYGCHQWGKSIHDHIHIP
jgi:hypothetical protein